MKDDDELCLCFHVTKRKVVQFLRVNRPALASQLSECYGAGTGCGWCRPYLKRLWEQSNPESVELPSSSDYQVQRAKYRDKSKEPNMNSPAKPDYGYLDVAKMIDHALLSPTLASDVLDEGCRMAAAYEVASVCIMPYYVRRCCELLAGSTVLPSTVIGFPHGGQATSTKVAEAKTAVADGAIELDMVVNISAVLSGRYDLVGDEIKAIVDVAHTANRKVKVIFENCYLQTSHKEQLSDISCQAGADWIKTSTGFGTGGATIDDLKLMLDRATGATQVKAAGGVRDLDTLLEVKSLGVTRVGASATAAILDDARMRLGLEPIHVARVESSGNY